uniref:Putative secreted protein n=1 Tax=Anopheles darlingi TaxID=43151 RepID=A0A2M4D8J2_ANODA
MLYPRVFHVLFHFFSLFFFAPFSIFCYPISCTLSRTRRVAYFPPSPFFFRFSFRSKTKLVTLYLTIFRAHKS